MSKISHCLWFDSQAEEAAKFYVSVFKGAPGAPGGKIGKTSRYPDVGIETHGGKPGSVLTVEFEIAGEKYLALNGGPVFVHNESFSIVVLCEDQKEIDYYWDALRAGGGEESQCGWLKDRYGISWQITPRIMGELMTDSDPKKVGRVMEAFLPMQKLDLAVIKRAYEGK
jgi:predicted 3-demethylubiquinone-9 3-methyltransferase (glyoxalase superfamily)